MNTITKTEKKTLELATHFVKSILHAGDTVECAYDIFEISRGNKKRAAIKM